MKQPFTSHSARVLLALVVGLIAGSLIAANPTPLLRGIVSWIEPVGTLWINALRMVVVPLVVSMLITGVASIADAGAVRRIGGITFGVWISLLLVSGVLGFVFVPLLFSGLTIDPAATAALRESASSLAEGTTAGLERMPTLQQWFTDLIPTNPVRAAADGAMLPLVIFSLAFGLAVTHIREDRRESLLRVFDGAAETMLVIVRWVLAFTPVGVLALSLGIASRVGGVAAGVLGYYLGVTALTMVVLSCVLFVIGAIVSRTPIRTLARAILPAQILGFTSRSSLATLPVQASALATHLRLPTQVSGFVLPLAVASFKPHGPLNWTSLAVVAALLYGVPLDSTALLTVIVSAVLLSFAVPGIPSAGMLLIAPVFTSVGIPVEAIGLLIAVDAIPDMFKTLANVTGQFTSTVMVARLAHRDSVAELVDAPVTVAAS